MKRENRNIQPGVSIICHMCGGEIMGSSHTKQLRTVDSKYTCEPCYRKHLSGIIRSNIYL